MSKLRLSRLLKQDVTYWANPQEDGYGGLSFDSPVALLGRWENKQVAMQSTRGVEFISKALVFLSQEVVLDGYLFLGTSVVTDPTSLTDARKIQRIDSIPSVSSDLFIYEAWL